MTGASAIQLNTVAAEAEGELQDDQRRLHRHVPGAAQGEDSKSVLADDPRRIARRDRLGLQDESGRCYREISKPGCRRPISTPTRAGCMTVRQL